VGDCFLASKDGKPAWLNIRCKSKPVWGKATQRWEYSVPKARWDIYCKMATEQPFWFIIEDKQSGKAYAGNLATLRQTAREYLGGNAPDKGGSVFLGKEVMVEFEF